MKLFQSSPKSGKLSVSSNVNYKPTKTGAENFGDRFGHFAKRFFDFAQIPIILGAVLVLLYLFVAQFGVVDGPSMEQTFHNGEVYIYEKVTTTWGNLQRGDVIVFQEDETNATTQQVTSRDLIKRIIGLPGDRIKVESGKVYVNNIAITENYLTAENKIVQPGTYLKEGEEITLTDNNYFVMGDNRVVSLDSRYFGSIEKSKIKGKVTFVFWPLSDIRIVSHIDYPELH